MPTIKNYAPENEKQIRKILDTPDDADQDDVLNQVDGINFTTSAAKLLLGGGSGWLRGDTILSYLFILTMISSLKCAVMDPFIWVHLWKIPMPQVKSRYRKTVSPLKNTPYIIVPIWINSGHWTLAIVNKTERPKVHYFDSYPGGVYKKQGKRALLLLEDLFLQCKVIDKPLIRIFEEGIPLQNNGRDCGPFILSYARSFLLKKNIFELSQSHMPVFRTHIFGVLKDFKSRTIPTYRPQTNLRLPPPDIELLLECSNQNASYVTTNPEGQLYTHDWDGDFRRLLRFKEVLSYLADNENEAWAKMRSIAASERDTVQKWFELSTFPHDHPRKFLWGSRGNANRMRKLFEEAHPHFALPPPPARKRKSWPKRLQKRNKFLQKSRK